MARKPYGKYDDLTTDKRESLRFKTWLETLLWGGAAYVLMQAETLLGPFPRWLSVGVSLFAIGAMLWVIVLMARSLSIMSPNPRRKVSDDDSSRPPG